MDIIRLTTAGDYEIVGKQCDKCRRAWRAHRSLEDQLEMYEFTRIEVHAGYGAVHFVDGDHLVADLCQCCCSAILGRVLRKIGNEWDREPTPEQEQLADDLFFDFLHPTPKVTPRTH